MDTLLRDQRAVAADGPKSDEAAAFRFGAFRLVTATRELTRDGKPLHLGGRALDILIALVARAGRVVGKEELLKLVWPGIFVEDSNLRVHVAALRQVLCDGQSGTRLIASVRGRGYCFVGSVKRLDAEEPDSIAAPPAGDDDRLPLPLVRIIGRDATVREVAAQLPLHRFVTVAGAGGIGKTAVASTVAERLAHVYADGVRFIDLAPLANHRLVPAYLASVLRVSNADTTALQRVIDHLTRRKLLLVLDNCEHVIETASLVAEEILRRAPGVHILATSREPLRALGEWVHRLGPLPVPPVSGRLTATEALQFPAVQLLAERVAANAGSFGLTDTDAAIAAALCAGLDGLPLAIELAAARIAVLGLQQVAARLEDRLEFLTGGRRTALPRHQTLRGTLDWSYELLSEAERHLLRCLAVFPSGFTLESATAVVGDINTVGFSAVDGIANLVTKSLVSSDGSAGRWRLLETIRAYALEKLAEHGEVEQTARRHAVFFRDLMAPTAPGPPLRPAVEQMTRYGREIENVHAALDWCFSATGDSAIGVVLTGAYVPVWMNLALMAECRQRTELALDALGSDLALSAPLRMQLHLALGVALIFTMGSVAYAKTAVARALDEARRLNEVDAQLRALWALCAVDFLIGECRTAQSIAEQLSLVARHAGDLSAIVLADRLMGYTLQYAGKPREAQRYFERVLEQFEAPKVQRQTTWFVSVVSREAWAGNFDQRVLGRAWLARTLWLQGFVDQAANAAQVALADAQAREHKHPICEVLHYAVFPIALMTGDLVAAEVAVSMLIGLAASLNTAFWNSMSRCLEGRLMIKRGEFREGSGLLRTALEALDDSGWTICYPEFLGVLAEALAGVGQHTEALAAIDQALERADQGGERWYVAELLRIKGDLLVGQSVALSIPGAEACLNQAIAVARQQGALFWELRGALSLSRLKLGQDRMDDARLVLAPVYSKFTEGFETADLRAARTLLETLR